MGGYRHTRRLQVCSVESVMDDQAQRFWDAYWVEQGVTVTAKTMTQILDRIKLGYLRSILPASGRCLEVGAGSGRLSCWLAQSGYWTVCMDFSPNALKAARMNYDSATVTGGFLSGDGFALPVQDRCFDVVLSTGLLEHFPDPTPIVREMVRVLKPGGLFYSDIVPKKFSLFRSLDWAGKLKRDLVGHRGEQDSFYERAFTSMQIRTLLCDGGLTNITVFPAGVVPPYLPLLYRSECLRALHVSWVEKTQRLWRGFDRTWVAEWLGFYYFAWGIKSS